MTDYNFTIRASDSDVPPSVATRDFTISVLDSPFPYVVSQLRGEGADEGTSIVDDAGVSWSRNGVVTDTAQFKLGSSSLRFGNGNYLSRGRNAGDNVGAEDFTLEAWVHPVSFSGASQFASIYSDRNGGANFNRQFWISSGQPMFTYGKAGDARTDYGFGSTIPLNEWSHLAVCRQGSTFRMFKDGVLANSFVEAAAIQAASATVYIGGSNGYSDARFQGWMHFRAIKGFALYTADFTPPLSFPTV